ncbi:MAG: DUF1801 domain-containing protein [Bacteroidetes bacterium]|nr:DUF1801 domain-containing protein [Bacteroidota bacterium]
MQIQSNTPEDYIAQLPEDRQQAIALLCQSIRNNIPQGFEECISYGMIGYVLPHALYPKGYHCNPKLPLPFINIASQKNFIAIYHMGIYASTQLMDWFLAEYPKHCKAKLDMGKSCIRFKKMDQIPYQLIGELASKITAQEWINMYGSNFVKNNEQ